MEIIGILVLIGIILGLSVVIKSIFGVLKWFFGLFTSNDKGGK